ncbi:MAG: hypothetical protein UU24_C0009G0009 [Candidatus Nomurabacteria bacterium GW2011_GWA2_40_9]|uniref:DUF3800 domain-containing protein n=1 Tax=Candidatus Nomurabacteria bacterium GW2011_GWA2_40_9 TaxID=1618734 RepID=A0A0G0W593_9BACT|nr:MAG: hypothetical protein UU24_C0009G0009 [Candidatus Nomurabacteria bacterium GW2011_GWA2_40_9]
MHVFIDDSGDAGFKLDKGSSEFFIISLIIFNDNLEVEKTAVAIKELRRELKFSDQAEFKFFKSRKDVKVQFLQTVSKFNFRIRSLVVEKKLIKSDHLKNNKNSFYSYAIKTALQYSNDSILNAKIRIDGSGDRVFRKNFRSYLRKQLNTEEKCVIENCKLVDSKKDVLIQLADMVAGSVRRSYDSTVTDSKTYKKIISKHIDNEWLFK